MSSSTVWRALTEPRSDLDWKDRIWAARDQLMAQPGFQRWLSRFPLTKLIANAKARAVFDMCAGFVYTKVITACVELKILEQLAEAPRTVDDLARRSAVPVDAMERLIGAAAALGLIARRRGGRWGLAQLGAAFLGNPGLAEMVRHNSIFYADLADPVALLRGEQTSTRLRAFWPYATSADPAAAPSAQSSADHDQRVAAYSRLMASSQAMLSDDILDAYPLRDRKRLIDIGGGEGVFARAVAARYPDLALTVFDLPPVAERARAALAAQGLERRIEAIGGDFARDALPRGADVISLVRVVHDHDDAKVMALLGAARAALAPGGVLLLAEPMASMSLGETMGDAYFGFYLLAMGSGRARTPERLMAMLTEAGFRNARQRATARPMFVRLITAEV